ncbi:MAG: CheW domain-containing protein [Rhodocyclaceae bacterium]|nr:CheW domain-containing protein [Rhodocyclaceae bacterium]
MNSHASGFDPSYQFLFATAGGCRFCLRLGDVERLLPLMQIQPVPDAPPYLAGIMNLAGEAVPVIDLARRLGLGDSPAYHLDNPVLLARAGGPGGRLAGLVVDDVLGVKRVPREAMRGEDLFRDGLPPVLGAVILDDGAALLLDSLRILDIDLSGLAEPLTLGEELLALSRETPPT